nr:MAG TPA: portal protein [Caudoviricetes sp.]
MDENQNLWSRLVHGWNAFMNRDPPMAYRDYGGGYSYRPDRVRFSRGNERTIVTSVITRIAMDCSDIRIVHADLDKNGRFKQEHDGGLNRCLTLEANLDQSGRAFIQDAVMTLLDEGHVALVPVETSSDPETGAFEIDSLRVGKVVEWYPADVKIDLYNEQNGRHEQIVMPKRSVGLVENPFYPIMNEPNSTMQRLVRKLMLLDVVDEQTSSGKLDLIIQLPYTIKTAARQEQAERRRKDIEQQLTGSKYGIAYTDGTEHITQLNRSLDNNLIKQVEYLQEVFWGQLGMTQEILNGTADDKTMLNYNNRVVGAIVSAIMDEMKRKFLSPSARGRGQSIVYFSEPFKLVPVSQIADIADKLRRNEILTSNELRQIVGFKPNDDPNSDILSNPNISKSKDEVAATYGKQKSNKEENQNGET